MLGATSRNRAIEAAKQSLLRSALAVGLVHCGGEGSSQLDLLVNRRQTLHYSLELGLALVRQEQLSGASSGRQGGLNERSGDGGHIWPRSAFHSLQACRWQMLQEVPGTKSGG